MARTPKSQILKNIKAQPNEFVYIDSGLLFSGYYHIISGRAFAGGDEKVYPQPVPLEKPSSNVLTGIINTIGLGTAAYNLAIRNKSTAHDLSPKQVIPQTVQKTTKYEAKSGINYYFQKSNDLNYIIKKISQDEAIQLAKDPINKIVSINFSAENLDAQLKSSEKIIQGITMFVNL